RAGFNGVAEFTRRRVEKVRAALRQHVWLQWGRRVHSAKSEAGGAHRLRVTVASMGSPSSLGEEGLLGDGFLRWADRFNGVAEFTRRRAAAAYCSPDHPGVASMGSPSSLGE